MIYAAFIGVDKHDDPRIRNLTGARRDAVALWSLFGDTIPDIQATLLVDADATVAAIRQSLDQTLNVAGEDDIVIVSFAGHGTRDHRIVACDTSLDTLADTTISMGELAARFKESKAKIVLCILDCCFSGEAPARVLEDSPTPRDPGDTLETLAGEGRILIAAANINEVAYEMPGGRHGILTKSLLDVLRADSDSVDLIEAMADVMQRVRAAAARIGVIQTPVMIGSVTGGLVMPALRPGKRFFAAFPELTGIKVGRAVSELVAFGFPQAVVDEWAAQFGGGLNDLQLQAVNEYRILDGDSLLMVAPTSSGKTFIGEMAAIRALVDGRKAVFLLPYKALVNEKYDQFSSLYAGKLGFRVIRCTGDRLDDTGSFIKGKYDLALLTYEMFLGLAVSSPFLLNQLGLVVMDEAQFITDPTRGITVELLLTYLIAAREKGIAPQLIALSAVIGDVNSFDDWLGCSKLVTQERPVPLTEGVIDRRGVYQYVDAAGAMHREQLIPATSIVQRTQKPSAQDVIVPLIEELLRARETEQIIVFRNRKGPAEGCAAYLARDLRLPPATEALAALPGHDLSTSSAKLRECLRGGTAFHNTNLLPEEKEIIERAYRKPGGNLRVLAATTTVAAGINTPASTVILAEQEFIGDDGRPFTVAEYKNMAGRAGRLGFNEEGRAIILANNEQEREVLFARYVRGTLDPLRSSFDPQHTETWILRLLAQVGEVARTDVTRLLANTFSGYLAIRHNPQWRGEMEQQLEALLQEMIGLGIIEEERKLVRLTLLGVVCGRSSLSFQSLLRLIGLVKAVQNVDLTAERLAALLQGLPELDQVVTPMMKTGRKENRQLAQSESGWPRQAVQTFGIEVVQTLQRNTSGFFQYYARCKRALLLSDWMQGTPMEAIEQRYSVNPFNAVAYGHVKSAADTTRFHLRAAHQIATVMLVDQGPSEQSLETLLRQLEVGIPADALDLLSVPVQLTRGEYLALRRAGIRRPGDLWAQSEESIGAMLGRIRAAQLEKSRPKPPIERP